MSAGATAEVRLRRGRAKPVWAGHSWVLSGAIDAVLGDPEAGDVVLVVDHDGRAVGRGFFSPASQIRVRMLSLDPGEEIDRAFFDRRIARAVRLREELRLPNDGTDVYRAIHGDGDGLPGVVADRYGAYAVLQLTVAGMERRRNLIAEVLAGALGLFGVHLAPVPAFAKFEGLEGAEGDIFGTPVPEELEVRENGIRFAVNARRGQKTGHFCDHRENRALVRTLVAGRSVLDAFSGTGGFAIAAALGGADEVVAADSSAFAIERAARNAEMNGVAGRIRYETGDVFPLLRRFEREGRRFGAVVLDPPSMARGRGELRGAMRGYKELNLRAMRLLLDGGLLVTASCTGIVGEPDFEKVLRDAAFDAKRDLTILFRRGQAPDHPWPIVMPESRYLKLFVGRCAARGV